MPITNPVHQHSLSACVDNSLALGAEKGTKLLVLGANRSESGMGRGSLRLVCLCQFVSFLQQLGPKL